MTRLRDSTSGAMPVGAIVGIAVALAAIVGLIAGAIWGLSGSRSPAPDDSAAPVTSAPVSTANPGSPVASPSSGETPGSSTAPSPSTAPTPDGSVPPAPATTTTSADGWRLGSWKITNTAGALGVSTTARNTATGTRSADLVLYVYVDGRWIATTTTRVTDVPAGGTVPVEFTGTDAWQPGQKVLLLQVT